MRMPSTPSPWPALAGSFILHAVVALGAWYFVGSGSRVPLEMKACVLEKSRLNLSLVFGDGKPRQQSSPIDTRVTESPLLDPAVKLDPAHEFNPIEFHSVAVQTPATVPSATPHPALPGTSMNAGATGHTGGGSPGHGGGNPGGPSFFQVGATGHSVVYVIDRSGSMGGSNGALTQAKAELLTSLQQLTADVQLQVLAYNNQEPHFLLIPEHLLSAEPATIAQFVRAVNDPDLLPRGKTDHVAALRRALSLKPDAIYWVTDGDDFHQAELTAVLRGNQSQTAIHVIEMVSYGLPKRDPALAQLAARTRGTYRAVNIGQQLTAIPGLPPQ